MWARVKVRIRVRGRGRVRVRGGDLPTWSGREWEEGASAVGARAEDG